MLTQYRSVAKYSLEKVGATVVTDIYYELAAYPVIVGYSKSQGLQLCQAPTQPSAGGRKILFRAAVG
jgi:hypothetical protein